jgi:sec-independent protein translocase protein TatA
MDYSLNILGSEWMIIIFVALVVLLGTNRLPDVAKKIGRAVGEYNKTKNQFQNNIKDFSNTNIEINGPVQNERQKLEMIAKSLGINFATKTDDELREIISSKIGQPSSDSDKK